MTEAEELTAWFERAQEWAVELEGTRLGRFFADVECLRLELVEDAFDFLEVLDAPALFVVPDDD